MPWAYFLVIKNLDTPQNSIPDGQGNHRQSHFQARDLEGNTLGFIPQTTPSVVGDWRWREERCVDYRELRALRRVSIGERSQALEGRGLQNSLVG